MKPDPIAPFYYFRKCHRLGEIPMDKLHRKFLIKGKPLTGKTKIICDSYKYACKIKYPDNLGQQYWFRRNYQYNKLEHHSDKDPEDVRPPTFQCKSVGYRTGDLRFFRYQNDKYIHKKKVSYNDYMLGEPEYGIETFGDDPKQAPFSNNPKFTELALSELNKRADAYFIDELTDVNYTDPKL